MKVQHSTAARPVLYFRDLQIGEAFDYREYLYVKTMNGDGLNCNCIRHRPDLWDWVSAFVAPHDEVTRRQVTLVVED